jgi:hypothetical protein
MSDDERALLLLIAGYIQRLESGAADMLGSGDPSADRLATLIGVRTATGSQPGTTAGKITALVARIKGEA